MQQHKLGGLELADEKNQLSQASRRITSPAGMAIKNCPSATPVGINYNATDGRNYGDAAFNELIPVSCCTIDRSTVIQSISARATVLFKAPRAELLGMRLDDAVGAVDPDSFTDCLRACMEADAQLPEDFTFYSRKAGGRELHLTIAQTRGPRQNVMGLVIVFVDVTKQKRVESQNRLLLQASEAFAASLDAEEIVQALSRCMLPFSADACAVDMRSPDGTFYRAASDHTSLEDRASLDELTSMLAYTPRAREERPAEPRQAYLVNEAQLQRRSKSAANAVSAMVVPMLVRDKHLATLILVTTQTSGRRYTEADINFVQEIALRAAFALDKAQAHGAMQHNLEARERALAIVSHDLLGMLTVILLQVESLGLAESHAEIDVCAGRIQRVSNRMVRLTNDLLDLASIDAGRLRMKMQNHLVAPLLDEVVSELLPVAAKKDLALEMFCSSTLSVCCDKDRFLQIATNLVNNAIKFSPPHSRIRFGAELASKDILFSVTDEGPGIPADQADKIFDSFWQAPANATPGRGLGLSIVRAVVEASGGKVWLSQETSAGAAFFFALPCSSEDETKGPIDAADGRVLVVDDDDSFREVLAEVLEGAGYSVDLAAGGREALAYLQAHRPKLIMLDLHMPGIDGWELLAERKRSTAMMQIPVIAMSGDRDALKRAGELNTCHLEKPLTSKRVIRVVEDLLARSADSAPAT